jgi:UDP-glucose 4-epimerase
MRSAEVKCLVLCSSFAVNDWYRASGTADETLALLDGGDVYRRGGHASAKLWQECLARRSADELGWQLTIIRPGFIWGRGNECRDGSMGPRVGPFQVIFAAGHQLPFTHLVNAADCFRAAIEAGESNGETLNLVDGYDLTAWRFKGEQLRRAHESGIRVWLPYWIVWPVIMAIFRSARLVLGSRMKLPFMFMPAGFAQGYRPLVFDTQRLSRVLGWQPPLTLERALDDTFTSERRP